MTVDRFTRAALCLFAALLAVPAVAEKKYGPGASDTEIKIGQTMPYSGPASAYGTFGKAMLGYFEKVNAEGGINGRKVRLMSLDDGYSPPKTVEQTRRLVEQEQVLLMFGSLGTATNSAVHKYLNAKGVPQLFISSIGTKWEDPANYPWTMSMSPSQKVESGVYARYVLKERPGAKIAVLYQNDDLGKDYLKALRVALGARADAMIVAEASYEVTDPTVDSQVVTLKGSGADTFLNFSSPKFAAMAIRKTAEIGWKPLHIVAIPGSSVGSSLRPAGLANAVGLVSAGSVKDPTDPQWQNDPGMKEWRAWMARYYPEGDTTDFFNVVAYLEAQLMTHVLKQCGDDLSRENVMRQAASLKGLELPLLLPGIRMQTSATDYAPIEQLQLHRFDGQRWVPFGEVLGQ